MKGSSRSAPLISVTLVSTLRLSLLRNVEMCSEARSRGENRIPASQGETSRVENEGDRGSEFAVLSCCRVVVLCVSSGERELTPRLILSAPCGSRTPRGNVLMLISPEDAG
ncbi:unnamed protein product [Pleuronectes platessa]|uniref:Secreted protein n=1 Tax=Pleuronectes platessa TaxID=8262 RepID=A0A9N7VN93_PLEPL|nr:unnamed protein product [Pleuronectes platessa]